MRRGSTPTFRFRLPAKAFAFSEITVIFAQDGKEVLSVGKDRLSEDGQEVFFTMTEEETMAFTSSCSAELQLRLEDTEGSVWISETRPFSVRKKYPEDLI